MNIGQNTAVVLTQLPSWIPESHAPYTQRTMGRLLMGFPELLRSLHDPEAAWPLSDMRPAPTAIAGGEFLQMPGRCGRFTDHPAVGFPVERTFRLLRRTDTLLRCEILESGRIEQLTCTPFEPQPDQHGLDVQWSATLPFAGPLRLHQAWFGNAMVEIKTEPTRYPWTALARLAAGSNEALMTLGQAELMDEFSSAHDPKEKCALLLVAIARMHPLFT